ncbi:hypothetical protein KUTeg_009578 [Tegillarca granosa]|uniref:Septin-type G domain-containing protein n=1 Tax=Tegillarca granosa TaxID=220873 RepID=A0ABQ9F7F8_TEGGR|nr:hypothetical protein KUTeg_009578 [Tegillarca granosa]
METSHSDNTETSHNCSDNTETSHNCSDNMETSHNCSDNGNQIVFESARKEVLEKSDVCDVVDSKTHRKSPLASNKNAHTKTTYEDVDHQKGSIRPSVERGRTHDIISSNDDTTGQQSTASFQVQPDTKNKRVRSQSPGWNFFSRSRVNSKGSNIPSKLRSLFSPKDKDKEKSPKMSPKFKPKNFKLFRKSDDVTQIWEIYDIDTPDGTNDTQTDVLGLSNQMQLSETRGTHPDISASGLQNQVRPSETRGIHPDISALGLQNQVQPSSDKIILPVTSKPTILSPSEAEQSLNVNKNPTVQTPINSVVLETDIYSHTHKNGTVTSAGSEITSDSLNLCKDTSKSPSDENFRELESNISAKRAENNSIYEDVVPSIVSPEIGKSDSLLEMINMKFDKENKQNLIPDSLLVQNNDTNLILDNDAPKPPVRRHSAKRQAIQLTTVSSMTPSGNSSQEQENEQVAHLSSGSNTQTPTQHQTSNGSRLSTQNDVDTASGIKYEMSQNSSSTKLSVPCLNVNASLLENNVKDVGTSPPPIPSPRRRLRRRFSLGPRKLDDDEFIGFASLPEQVHRKAVKRGFEFSLMVVGECGLGKSTLINSLFLTDLYKDRKLPTVQDNVNKTVEISKKSLEIEERGVKLRLTIVDTPGYNDAVNGEECWKNIIDYFEQYYQAESGLNRKNIQDTRVHCCLYFISPYGHGLKPMDVNFMKKLHKKCNIVPLAAIPFAVVGSNTVVEAGGKRIRGRMYPWGIVEVDNPSHCDFTKLRQMLISTHMQDLKDITSDVHYENYRAEHLASQMNKSQKERSKLKRDSVTNIESVVETEKLLQQKEAEIQRMQAMLAKMQAQLHGGSGQQVNGTVTNTQI